MRQVGHLPRQLRQERLHDPLLRLSARDLGVPVLTRVHEYEYIRVRHVADSPSGKTSIWHVETRYGDTLGSIRWFGRWRQYTFWPSPETLYSAGCLTDLADFIQLLRKSASREFGSET